MNAPARWSVSAASRSQRAGDPMNGHVKATDALDLNREEAIGIAADLAFDGDRFPDHDRADARIYLAILAMGREPRDAEHWRDQLEAIGRRVAPLLRPLGVDPAAVAGAVLVAFGRQHEREDKS